MFSRPCPGALTQLQAHGAARSRCQAVRRFFIEFLPQHVAQQGLRHGFKSWTRILLYQATAVVYALSIPA